MKLLKRPFLLIILPIAVGVTAFAFLRSDSIKRRIYDRPLRVALEKGDYANVKYWVIQGGDVNMSALRNGNGPFTTPILLAIQHRDVATARELIRRGADLGFPRPALSSSGQLVYQAFGPDQYPLWEAIKNEDEPMVNLLLKSGADPNEGIESHDFSAYELASHECNLKPTPKCPRILSLIKPYLKPRYT